MVIEAIVIKRTPFREHDHLVALYSKDGGKLSALAKGALKPKSVQALQIDPGNLIHCELVPSRTGLPIMTGAQTVRCYSNMKSTPQTLAAGSFFLQVIDSIVFDQQADGRLWECLKGALEELDAVQEKEVMHLLRKYQVHFLEALGYGRLEFEKAVHLQPVRSVTDDFFEQLANRRFKSLDLFFELNS